MTRTPTPEEIAREAVAELRSIAKSINANVPGAVADDIARRLRGHAALITELTKALPPDGWQVVPREPT